LVEAFNAEMLAVYAMACGWVLARAHSRARSTGILYFER
jgi:hypothetical protein